MTYLCVSIFVTDPALAKRDIARAAEAGADLVELRVDQFTDASLLGEIIRGSVVPCIVTCRAAWEGGSSELPDAQRLALLQSAADAGASYIDLELKTVQDPAVQEQFRRMMADVDGRDRPRAILSSHDFTGRPARLYNIVAEMNALPNQVNKLAWMARSIRDNPEAFELLKTRQKPTIALCMGEAGLISRVLARKFGAFLTFASLEKAAATAAGQVPVADMKSLYRWDQIQPDTKVYGVVASPVMHSMSPAIHNAAFDQVHHNGVYLPMLVEAGYESFKAFMETFAHFDGLDLAGLSITIPHKENALRYLQEKGAQVEPLATSIGALNTIIIERDGQVPVLRGINTDYAAILDSITAKLGIARADLARYRVAVIGAGGTGRTAVAALAHYGAGVTIYNRTLERAEELAREFDGKSGPVAAAPLEDLASSSCDIYLNTTSVGMYPKVDASPAGEHPPRFGPRTLVFDTIYNPMKTKLLRQAEEAGAPTIGGVEMFVRQAAAQFEAWTQTPAPVDVMRRVIEQRLSNQAS